MHRNRLRAGRLGEQLVFDERDTARLQELCRHFTNPRIRCHLPKIRIKQSGVNVVIHLLGVKLGKRLPILRRTQIGDELTVVDALHGVLNLHNLRVVQDAVENNEAIHIKLLHTFGCYLHIQKMREIK